MLKDALTKALNAQVNAEYYSAYLYLAMSAGANQAGFKGTANWLFVQAQEEMAHGTHIYQHILERGGAPAFADIKAPSTAFHCHSLKELFQKVLEHERTVTESIGNIASLAMREGDHASYNFIMWYVSEQIEEEGSVNDILAKIALTEGSPGQLFTVDTELGARVFVHPFGAGAA